MFCQVEKLIVAYSDEFHRLQTILKVDVCIYSEYFHIFFPALHI
jgi:hypothetical protein